MSLPSKSVKDPAYATQPPQASGVDKRRRADGLACEPSGSPDFQDPSTAGRPTAASPSRTRHLAYSALLASLALIFSYIEVLIPFNFGIPGVKLGIANLVVIIALYHLGPRYAFTINMIRVLVAGLLFSGLFGCLYSLAGALLSFAVMVLTKKTGLFSVTGVSICGGVFHNLGQILIATFLVSSLKMFAYFPVLIISGVISGTIIGIVAHLILQRLPRA